ncbi:MAG: GNAT family N-acetyltransferase [Aestuariibacter sp.]
MQYEILDVSYIKNVGELVMKLTNEISERTGQQQFDINTTMICNNLREFMSESQYTVVGACFSGTLIGFGTICESCSLYAGGRFGVIQEFYVLPEYRCKGVGRHLIARIIEYGQSKMWRRLELCTPPVPEFDSTLSFYEGTGFEITGGHKMKYML